MASQRSLASRARGLFLGAAVGDALGWPQEQNSGIVGGAQSREVEPRADFRSWARFSGGQFRKYVETVGAGEYSDDTQLLLAVARVVQAKDWRSALADTELPLFLLYSRGAGGATLRACRQWAAGHPPWLMRADAGAEKRLQQYFSAGGNGAAMRIGPHAVVSDPRDPVELVRRVIADGVMTHGHPRALVGAAVYAVAAQVLLSTESTLGYGELVDRVAGIAAWQQPEIALSSLPDEWHDMAGHFWPNGLATWQSTIEEVRGMLRVVGSSIISGSLGNDGAVLERIGCLDKKVNGSGTVTAAGAIYLASRNAPRPMSGLLRAAFLRSADTDTLASMTAGLLGALHGTDWLEPFAASVQDYDYIMKMADRCTGVAFGELPSAASTRPVRDRDLRNFKSSLLDGIPSVLPDGRPISAVEYVDLEPRSTSRARRWILQAESQTLFVDVSQRMPIAGDPARPKTPQMSLQEQTTASLTRVSLLADDLDAIEKFYGREGLGLDTMRSRNGHLYAGRTLRFVRGTAARQASTSSVLLDIEVDDLDRVARRLGLAIPDQTELRLVDPSGNQVWVRAVREHHG